MSEKGRPLPKFGEWDVNDPASAEGFTVIFNKARNEKKTGGKPESPSKADSNLKHGVDSVKPQASRINFVMAFAEEVVLLHAIPTGQSLIRFSYTIPSKDDKFVVSFYLFCKKGAVCR